MKLWARFKAWVSGRLVPEAKQAWRWLSIQMMALAAAIQTAWASLDDQTKAALPGKLVAYTTIGLLVLGIGGRLLKQKKPD